MAIFEKRKGRERKNKRYSLKNYIAGNQHNTQTKPRNSSTSMLFRKFQDLSLEVCARNITSLEAEAKDHLIPGIQGHNGQWARACLLKRKKEKEKEEFQKWRQLPQE